MSTQTVFLYFLTWLIVAVTPGPAVMYAMSNATRYGPRPALAGILGIQIGNLAFFAATASGLAALLATAATAFEILRWAGAAYLVYLGVRAIISTFRAKDASAKPIEIPRQRNLLVQGVTIQLTNPKALLFTSALLPQFIQPSAALYPQLLILSLVTVGVDLVVLSTYAWLAHQGKRALRLSAATRWLERIFGAAMVFFGLRLLSRR